MENHRPGLEKVGRGYRTLALLVFNTMVVLVLLNVLAWPLARLLPSPQESYLKAFLAEHREYLEPAYRPMSPAQIERLWHETWTRPFVFRPWTLFGEAPFAGEFVNVRGKGFREGLESQAWPPREEDFNIFVFGGSTIFGYAVDDEQTVPAQIGNYLRSSQPRANIEVYNFGQGNYYSTQERILFEDLLRGGLPIDLAIFIDGLNEFHFYDDRPQFSTEFRQAFLTGQADFSIEPEPSLPFVRLVTRLWAFWAGLPGSPLEPEVVRDRQKREEAISRVLLNYRNNQRLIEAVADSLDVRVAFVWQPVPGYPDFQAGYPFEDRLGLHRLSSWGYQPASRLAEAGFFGQNFIWCADLQHDGPEVAYVDPIHYSPAFSQVLAQEIVRQLEEGGFVTSPGLKSGETQGNPETK